jgi:phospholipase/carboxylesterase
MLHGAGGSAQNGLNPLRRLVDATGLILLAPDSREATWDVIRGGYGPDVAFIDQALARVFERYAVDRKRLIIGGFSDGASYALSLGLTNGDLFTHVLAFSPGFMAPAEYRGKPHLFVSHGTRDQVLPIDRCSRRLVPLLQRGGYDVQYREFAGGHTVPADIAHEALTWLSRGSLAAEPGS